MMLHGMGNMYIACTHILSTEKLATTKTSYGMIHC